VLAANGLVGAGLLGAVQDPAGNFSLIKSNPADAAPTNAIGGLEIANPVIVDAAAL
jgi:hypothetical protein